MAQAMWLVIGRPAGADCSQDTYTCQALRNYSAYRNVSDRHFPHTPRAVVRTLGCDGPTLSRDCYISATMAGRTWRTRCEARSKTGSTRSVVGTGVEALLSVSAGSRNPVTNKPIIPMNWE